MERTVLVGTSRGLYDLDSPTPLAFDDRRVNALAAEPRSVWAVLDGAELWQAHDDWDHQVTISGLRAICTLPVGGDVLIGTSEAHLRRVREGAVEEVNSFEEAPGRDEWFTPWGGPPDVRSFAAASSGLFVNVHVGGVLRSTDNAASWIPTIDIRSDVHEVVARDDYLLAATGRGLATSGDAGESWTFDTEGLHAPYCRAVVLSSDDVLVSASVGPHGGRAALYRGRLGKTGLEKCSDGLPEWFGDNIDTHCVASSRGLAAFGTSDGRVFVSTDSGATWEQVQDGLPPVRALVIAGD